MRNLDARPRSHKYAQGIIHDGDNRGHTAVLYTRDQHSIVGMGGWEIIKRHNTWIYAQCVNMGDYSKAGRRFKLVDTKGVAKKRLNGNNYLLIVRQALFNPNSDKTLLAEDQIECFGVKVYLHPRAFGRKQLIDARCQVGNSVKLGISWDGSTRYLDIHPPTREDVNRLGSLKLTRREPYSTYITFGRSNRKFKLDETCLGKGRVNMTWNNKEIQ